MKNNYCKDEKCHCGIDATHKIAEVIFDTKKHKHELTQYVCDYHFDKALRPYINSNNIFNNNILNNLQKFNNAEIIFKNNFKKNECHIDYDSNGYKVIINSIIEANEKDFYKADVIKMLRSVAEGIDDLYRPYTTNNIQGYEYVEELIKVNEASNDFSTKPGFVEKRIEQMLETELNNDKTIIDKSEAKKIIKSDLAKKYWSEKSKL